MLCIECKLYFHPQWWGDDVDGLEQDWSNSIGNALDLLQLCSKPLMWYMIYSNFRASTFGTSAVNINFALTIYSDGFRQTFTEGKGAVKSYLTIIRCNVLAQSRKYLLRPRLKYMGWTFINLWPFLQTSFIWFITWKRCYFWWKCGVPFVGSNSDLRCTSANAGMYIISRYIGPRYNGTPPYLFLRSLFNYRWLSGQISKCGWYIPIFTKCWGHPMKVKFLCE